MTLELYSDRVRLLDENPSLDVYRGVALNRQHIRPVNFDITWLQSNTDAGFGVIPDSDDLNSQMFFGQIPVVTPQAD